MQEHGSLYGGGPDVRHSLGVRGVEAHREYNLDEDLLGQRREGRDDGLDVGHQEGAAAAPRVGNAAAFPSVQLMYR